MLVADHRDLLSNDLGAIAGLLFDIGSGRYTAPPRDNDAEARAAWEADLARMREEGEKARKAKEAEREGDRTHTEVQGWLRDLGRSLGFDVWIAANDRNRSYNGVRYLPYGELERHRASMARFGAGMKAVEAIARRLM